MFETRLKVLLVISCLVGCAIVVRMFDLQVVHAAYYRARAERAMLSRPKPLPFIRGSIVDRTGSVLVSDEASWDLAIDYPILAFDAGVLTQDNEDRLHRWLRLYPLDEGEDTSARVDALRDDIGRMWMDIALFTFGSQGVTVTELRAQAAEIVSRVNRVRNAVARRRGFDSPVAEERMAHAQVSGLAGTELVAARERFARYPWVHVQPSSQRRYSPNGAAFAHVLGRMGRVDAEDVERDPNADDPFRKYLADEYVGITGVERLAENALRGRRGSMTLDNKGRVLQDELIEAENGRTVQVTIHATFQQELYNLLGATVEQVPESTGGAAVVLDVASREVLALVSYPSFDPNRFSELYAELRDDTKRLPLWFRAISSGYAPGSTVKPLVCLAGLMNNVITTETVETCTGYLFDDVRDRWRCWEVYGTGMRKAHGSIDVVDALKGSCNIFMYRLGERLGVGRICNALDMIGAGRPSGVGLTGEASGINPTSAWLMSERGVAATPGKARHFAMGQGEILMTPLQVANLMATYAGGDYKQVSLVRSGEPQPTWNLPPTRAHWLAIRRGMYGVVNDADGTAYKHAHFEDDRFVLCGKTGSASVHPRPTSYSMTFVDANGQERTEIVPAGSRAEAERRILFDHPDVTIDNERVDVATRWPATPPPTGELHAHAWFGGFLQPRRPDGAPDWSKPSPWAFAVLVEYGSSGGRTSGPLAKQVSRLLVDTMDTGIDGTLTFARGGSSP